MPNNSQPMKMGNTILMITMICILWFVSDSVCDVCYVCACCYGARRISSTIAHNYFSYCEYVCRSRALAFTQIPSGASKHHKLSWAPRIDESLITFILKWLKHAEYYTKSNATSILIAFDETQGIRINVKTKSKQQETKNRSKSRCWIVQCYLEW